MQQNSSIDIQHKLDSHFSYPNRIYYIKGYKSAHSMAVFKCSHGHIIKRDLADLLRSNGCLQCIKNHKYDCKLQKIYGNSIKRLSDVHQSVTCKCNHNHIFTIGHSYLLRGHGCPLCRKSQRFLDKVKRMSKKQNKDRLTPLNVYHHSCKLHDVMSFKCKHGHITRMTVKHFYECCHRNGCPVCAKRRKFKKAQHQIWLQSHHTILMIPYHFVNYCHKVPFVCMRCHHMWNIEPYRILKDKRGCPVCKTYQRTDFIFRQQLAKASHNRIIEYPIGQYKSDKHKVQLAWVQNLTKKFFNTPKNILRNPISPQQMYIRHEIRRRQHAKAFDKQLFRRHNGKLKRVSKYISSSTKTKFVCNKGHIWYTVPSHALNEFCPKCNASYGESLVVNFLSDMHFKSNQHKIMPANNTFTYAYYFHSKAETGHLLHADVLLNWNHQLYDIEFDGKQHFHLTDWSGKLTQKQLYHALRSNQHRDHLKDRYCYNHHIIMVRIKNPKNYTGNKLIHLVYYGMHDMIRKYTSKGTKYYQMSLF